MFAIVNEEKLSTDDRKNLDRKLFGLPEHRKYPLNDKEHVRKAIQFFKFCPAKDKNELAKNINKRIKELDMKIEVSKDNPFYKYSNKMEISVTESANSLKHGDINWFYKIDDVISNCKYSDRVKMFFDNFIGKAPSHVYRDIKDIEHEACAIIHPLISTYNDMREKDDDFKYINPMGALNIIMNDIYTDYLDYMDYASPCKPTAKLYYLIINDIFSSAIGKIQTETNYNYIDREITLISSLLTQIPGKPRFVLRKLYELREQILISLSWFNNKDTIERMKVYLNEINKLKDITHASVVDETGGYDDFEYLLHIVMDPNNNVVKFSTVENHLKYVKRECEKELLGLYKSRNTRDLNGYIRTSLDDGTPTHIKEIIDHVNYAIHPECVRSIINYSTSIHLYWHQLMLVSKLDNYADYIYIAKTKFMDEVYFAIKGENIYLITVDLMKSSHSLVLVEITKLNMNFLTTYLQVEGLNLRTIPIDFKPRTESLNLSGLTEGISIDGDGNIKFIISHKKSYMDTYMENHKLLVENWKNKNYKGVKENLAYVFALIHVIERDKKYKKKDSELLKARAFAINDFKTYLKQLQKEEPNFDFATYYKESDYDKIIVDVPIETISGIKKLVKGLLLS